LEKSRSEKVGEALIGCGIVLAIALIFFNGWVTGYDEGVKDTVNQKVTAVKMPDGRMEVSKLPKK